MPKWFLVIIIILIVLVGGALIYSFLGVSNPEEKVYVAVEGDGKIVVLDPLTRTVLRTIDLSTPHEGRVLMFQPHNIQVAPDGKSVWVTANVGGHQAHTSFIPQAKAHGDGESLLDEPDEVVVIDPSKDRIIKRIPIGVGFHLAHVVLTPDSSFAYITAQQKGVIIKVNAKTLEVVNEILAPPQSEPHGIRVAPDGSKAYVAVLKGKGIGILDLATDAFNVVPVNGQAVQAGITPDGKVVVASLYDTKKLAVYDTGSKSVRYVDLPSEAKGPIQMYQTPDSRYSYVADQGYYFEQPVGEMVYKIDLVEGSVIKEIKTGSAPHGVVVAKDGKMVYVTNLLSGDVSFIDTVTDQEISRVKVGKEPNGISVWSKSAGGTP